MAIAVYGGYVLTRVVEEKSSRVVEVLLSLLVNVHAWQLALAVGFMLGGIYGLFRAGARLYQNAVLHSGARLRLREAWRGEPARPQPAQR
jgi:ABC-type Na+ efflux pump permease subunit